MGTDDEEERIIFVPKDDERRRLRFEQKAIDKLLE